MSTLALPLTIQREPVIAGHIRSVGYDKATGTLDVELASTRVHRHFDVPADLHQQLISADSVGEIYERHIRRRFGQVDLETLDQHEGSTAD